MTHLLNRKQDNIQNKPSNHVWQEIYFFHNSNGHDAIAQLI